MRTLLFPLILLGCTVQAAQPISAEKAKAAVELAKSSGCLTCHSTSEKVVGPAYAKVAAKYKDDKDAVSSLTQSIQYGSQGKWGRIPMPAHASMSVEDIQSLARWVLSIEQ